MKGPVVGMDVGARNVKVVVIKDGSVIGQHVMEAGFETASSCEMCFKNALKVSGIKEKDVKLMAVTGAGKDSVPWADISVTEILADARGIHSLDPFCRTCVDVGAEEARAMGMDKEGKVLDFAINEKCAAGSGAFLEAMARALELPIEEFSKIGLLSQRKVPMNAQCVVFAESEVVSMIHTGFSKEDISRAIHDAMAERVASMTLRVKPEDKIYAIGGVALSPCFIKSLEKSLGRTIYTPKRINPMLIGALGAGLVALENLEKA